MFDSLLVPHIVYVALGCYEFFLALQNEFFNKVLQRKRGIMQYNDMYDNTRFHHMFFGDIFFCIYKSLTSNYMFISKLIQKHRQFFQKNDQIDKKFLLYLLLPLI